MSENDAATISHILEHCATLLSWQFTNSKYGSGQLGNSLMDLLYSLSHLITTGKEIDKQEAICMELALAFIGIADSTEKALKILETYAESRNSHLEVMDRVMQQCYEYFADSQNPRKLRIHALRCVGFALAVREADYMLKSLDLILTPRLKMLQMIVEGQMATSSQSTETLEEECIFELAVLSALIATQKPKMEVSGVSSLTNKSRTTVVYAVLWQCLPLLLNMLRNFSSSEILVEKVCDVLRSGLIAAQDDAPAFLDSYCDVLDFIMLRHSASACKLAKSLILICSSNNVDKCAKIPTRMASWFKNIFNSMDEFSEDYVELAYHIVKKDWKLVSRTPQMGYIFLRTVRDMALKVSLLFR